MASRYCNWCGKHRTKFSGIEKCSLLTDRWSEMCNYCYRRHDRVMCTNPLAGIFGDRTRPLTPQHKEQP